MLPTDMVDKEVDGSLLDTPLDLSYPVNEKETEGSVVGLVLDRLYWEQRPVLLIDGGVR
jgi:TPP-dependent 2-oxoacid decarboxylase